jgi:uncharacterized protein with NRDE domain
MCTLILLHRCVDGAPLVAAANRDEYLDRPAAPPAVRFAEGVPVAAPQDLRAGGTWLGLAGNGLFAALTNRPTTTLDPARRSRGLLVMDMLAASDASAAAERLQRIPAGHYNPFNLVVADGRHAFALVYEDAPRLEALAPGAHVIGNADPDAADVPKVARLRARAEAVSHGPAGDVLDALGSLCRGHDGGGRSPLDDACIHTPRYGTRSSTLLRVADRPERDVFYFADGPPCSTPYEDFTHLLGALDRAVESGPGPRVARTAS